MGYHTEFRGRVEIMPPLNRDEIAYLAVVRPAALEG